MANMARNECTCVCHGLIQVQVYNQVMWPLKSFLYLYNDQYSSLFLSDSICFTDPLTLCSAKSQCVVPKTIEGTVCKINEQ